MKVLLSIPILTVLFIGLAQAEIEKKADAAQYHQSLLNQYVVNATTTHKVTCNDDIIAGYCAKYGVYKSEFEKGNN